MGHSTETRVIQYLPHQRAGSWNSAASKAPIPPPARLASSHLAAVTPEQASFSASVRSSKRLRNSGAGLEIEYRSRNHA